ncbi:MAG: NAD-dependent DNA ligase LigA, partial [Apilactobacillus kunkeei]|nr:NAD-dependent DNA ligase LigA [Apilactobacillus kunkeei]
MTDQSNDIQTEYNKLKDQLKTWSRQYYQEDSPSVEDHVYDMSYRRLQEIEASHPDLIASDSPTQNVGGQTLPGFNKVNHEIPMLSLGDVFSEEELKDFID